VLIRPIRTVARAVAGGAVGEVLAMTGDGEPAASGADGVRSLAVALAVEESLRTGRRVDVPS
jgi:1,5-anhydro-D-fructose reductase (1,5-anhydro-D-mannitol-forming)